MLPEVTKLELRPQTSETPKLGKSFLFDFTTGDFVIKDGRLVRVEDIDALKVWITKIIKTERFRFRIYERSDKDEYGVTIEDLIVGHDYPPAFIESELKREVTAALTRHPLIQDLTEWKIEKENPLVKVYFRVLLATGTSFTQEVTV